MKITQSQAFQYGTELRKFMKTDAFEAAVSLTRETYQKQFFGSKAGESAIREQVYRQNQALDDLLDSLNAFVVNAQMNEQIEDDEE